MTAAKWVFPRTGQELEPPPPLLTEATAAGQELGPDRRPAPSEAEFQELVVAYARMQGWRVAHFRAARTLQGWRTPVAGDGAGFVDLVLARERVVFAELKSDTGRLSHAQREWLVALRGAGAEVHVWRPSDWPEVEATLKRRTP